MKIVVAYVPVLHEGYHKFFMRHRDADILFVLGRNFIENSRALVKDIRAMDPNDIVSCIRALDIFQNVYVLDIMSQVDSVNSDKRIIVTPEDDVVSPMVVELFNKCEVSIEPVFLRWDKTKSLSQNAILPKMVISIKELEREMMTLALKESSKSDDWWRQVGAVASYEGRPLITAYNRHVPTSHVLAILGDPRVNFNKGVHIEISTAIHSEAALISLAAKDLDISLSGADLFVTTFPCPPCAKLIAYSGIKRLFYGEGYSVLDGQDVLVSQDVEILRVQI